MQKKTLYVAKAEKCKVGYKKNMRNYNRLSGRKEDEAFYQYKSRKTVILLLPCSDCMFPLLCDS
ncbi:hypothetical protein HID58_023083 [Brassica napus]|uniref:Uncharacterized protein n=1 Tax=Brassica napus TaxID=3708 RepID=A0ABQ8D3F0_BRANA|nr:hypothetical protein HID58_023083 [Brassica napus]